jgi:hypothetical protein
MLTVLEEKLAEAHGLAIGASVVTARLAEWVDLASLRPELEGMRRDAEETRARCVRAEESFGDDLATEMLAHANTTSEKTSDLTSAWIKGGTGPLAAWAFLAMGEAGEVAVWTTVARLAARAGSESVRELAAWALPVQERHLRTALDGAAALAGSVDPLGPRWG